MKYRKKPVVIEAVQITEDMLKFKETWPEWFVDAVFEKEITIHSPTSHVGVETLSGIVAAGPGDWIIKGGVKGEFYPCKPDIFEATYEPVEEPRLPDPAIGG